MDFKTVKLLKAPAKRDARNLKLAGLLKKLPPLAAEFNCDSCFPFPIPTPMFGNDQLGDCVIAGRAHQTLRFEAFEQSKAIPISDQDAVDEYFSESGGQDSGLVLLDSLKEWRKKGWLAAGERYNAFGFAELDRSKHAEITASIYFLRGANIGLQLPLSAQSQIANGEIWDVTEDPNFDPYGPAAPGSWGGHCVYLVAYDPAGPVCVTWGQLQQMTWAFFDADCDEAYGIVQNREAFVAGSPVDVALLEQEIAEITGQAPPAPTPPQPVPPSPPAPPSPVPTPTKDEMAKVGNWLVEQSNA